MMTAIIYLTTVLLSLHAASSYILLTANLEDFNAIASQIAASPVGAQINQIIRRATSLFNQHVNGPDRPQQRAQEDHDKDSASDGDSLSDKDEAYMKDRDSNMVVRRTGEDEVVALGKNASYYLQSIKKIFENV